MAYKKIQEMNADVFKALAHPLRIEVIDILQKKELCFSDILQQAGGIKSNLSQHLSILVEKGILKSRKDSRCTYFKLASPKVAKVRLLVNEILTDHITGQNKLLKKVS
ncbi:MAG: winged helix-turn-helix transcriptional regulator [Bacteroidetes bacterium]|nr:winged helix-turn-helix transcriptional regulator [Bacteroidota bacterium]